MNPTESRLEFLATVIKLLARHEHLSLAQLCHKTRAFRKPRRMSRDAAFKLLEEFTSQGWIGKTILNSRVVYQTRALDAKNSLKHVEHAQIAEVSAQTLELSVDMLEAGATSNNEVLAQLIKHGLKAKETQSEESSK